MNESLSLVESISLSIGMAILYSIGWSAGAAVGRRARKRELAALERERVAALREAAADARFVAVLSKRLDRGPLPKEFN